MRLLGIDPGLHLTGYGCVTVPEAGAEPTLVEGGVLRLDPRRPLAARLEQLAGDLEDVLGELTPHVIAVEKLFTHYRHVRTAIQMAHARGVVLLAAQRRGLEIEELSATAVKKAMTGHGHASKTQIQHVVMSQCGLAAPPSPPDVADAIAIAICAARRRSAVPTVA